MSRNLQRIRRWVDEIDYGALLPLMARFPVRAARRLAVWRSRVRSRIMADGRRAAEANASRVLPEAGEGRISSIIGRSAAAVSRDELETFWFRRPPGDLASMVELSRLDRLRQARERGRGVLLFTLHCGTPGLALTALGRMGYPIHLIFRPPEKVPGKARAWYRYARKRIDLMERACGRPVLYTGRSGYFAMRRALRAGEMVMVALDVFPEFAKRSVTARFLGRTARFPAGVARLCLDTQASVVFWRTRPLDLCRVEFEDMTEQVQAAANASDLTQVLVDKLESAVLERPEDWHMWEALHLFFVPEEEAQGEGVPGDAEGA